MKYYMKVFRKMIMMLTVLAAFVSCTEDQPVVEYLDVTPNNISGEWMLTHWNGSPLNEGTYFYIEFIRKEREFVIYQNFDSIGDVPQVVTGYFNIETDVEFGAVIRGMYDFDGGFWAHDYEVNNLTDQQMEWVAVDDRSFSQKFVKCRIPAELKK